MTNAMPIWQNPGAHRPETILDSLKADQLELTPEELAKLG